MMPSRSTKNSNPQRVHFPMTMKPGCAECRRLARMLEEAAIHYYEMGQHVVSLRETDPEKVWAGMALRGATEAKDEIQWQFNEHLAKHAPEKVQE